MRRLPRAGVLLAAWLATSCGAGRLALPTGPGTPAPDAPEIFRQSTLACRRVTSFSAEIGVSGRANGQRLRGRVLAGLAAPSSVLLDATAPFGASLFIYAARDARVTLWLPRDRRVLEHDDPAAVLEAITGVPLEPAVLRRTLTGCPADEPPAGGRAFGTAWRVVSMTDGDVFLRQESGGSAWHVVALTQGRGAAAWRAEFSSFAAGLPGTVRLVSGGSGDRFDIRLSLSQVEVNPSLGPEVFQIRIPDAADPISLDELRRSGPLGESRAP